MKAQSYVTMNRLTHSWIIMQPNKNGGFSPCAAYARLCEAVNACDAMNYPQSTTTQQQTQKVA